MATVTHHPETETFTIDCKIWSNTYLLADLEKWIAFYRRMRVDYPKSGDSYDGAIAALEAFAEQMGWDA